MPSDFGTRLGIHLEERKQTGKENVDPQESLGVFADALLGVASQYLGCRLKQYQEIAHPITAVDKHTEWQIIHVLQFRQGQSRNPFITLHVNSSGLKPMVTFKSSLLCLSLSPCEKTTQVWEQLCDKIRL